MIIIFVIEFLSDIPHWLMDIYTAGNHIARCTVDSPGSYSVETTIGDAR